MKTQQTDLLLQVEQNHSKRLDYLYNQALDNIHEIKSKLAPNREEPSNWGDDAFTYQKEFCEDGFLSILEDTINSIVFINNSLNVCSPSLPPIDMLRTAEDKVDSLIEMLDKDNNLERLGLLHIEDNLDNLQYYLDQLFYEMED